MENQTHIGNNFFQRFIKKHKEEGNLIVQPRMGYSEKDAMLLGLSKVKELGIPVIGTITIDSFTRLGDFESARRAIQNGDSLNGYPIVSYNNEENRSLINNIRTEDFPIQVRHGSPLAFEIFNATCNSGIDAIEGGPVSYCLPYSRVPLKESIKAWERCCDMWASKGEGAYHLESFGGCMMGQLCPPSMLIAISVLEAIFFNYYGIKSVSLSLAQGTNSGQDLAALKAIRNLGFKYLPEDMDWHVVFYTFMGKFPSTYKGAKAIIEESARLAKLGGANRLIVKTVNEAHQIPTINDNLQALKWTHKAANFENLKERKINWNQYFEICEEADSIIQAVLNLDNNPGKAIEKAFVKGLLDIPFCLHPSNNKQTLSSIDDAGNILWIKCGKVPIADVKKQIGKELTSYQLMEMLTYNQKKYDQIQLYHSVV
jgi:methylaspartate mutase epsilon subunit